ncbi:MAG: hypothetical protein NTU44_03040 [Bacteroidetes bacterium]|nr:hypothetical protein [Bacteroidota bacterium]
MKRLCKGIFPVTALVFILLTNLVYCQSTIYGYLTYGNLAHTPMDGVKLFLKPAGGVAIDSVYTDQNGYYSFHKVSVGQYFIIPVSEKPWGGGNSIDALLIMKHFTGITPLIGVYLTGADVNATNSINSVDALLDMKRFVGLMNSFIVGDWVFENDTILVYGAGYFQHDFFGICFGDVNGSYNPLPCFPYPTLADAGSDSLNIPGTTMILQGNVPVSGDGKWKIISGTGGSITDPNAAITSFTGLTGNTYILSWNITTHCFTSSDTITLSFASSMGQPCPGVPSFSYGGQTYNTVQIGEQCWMKENLNIGVMIIGSENQADNGTIEKYCYDNDATNCIIYGGLYQWDEMMQYFNSIGLQGICPFGWHVPSNADWCTLTSALDPSPDCEYGYPSYIAGGKMKEPGTTYWDLPNSGANNQSGFTGFGGGWRATNGYGAFHTLGRFWSSSGIDNDMSESRDLSFLNEFLSKSIFTKKAGFSIRCLRNDCSQPTTQANAGPDQNNLTGNITFLQGNDILEGETGEWSIVSGEGGFFANIHKPDLWFSGTVGHNYTLRWTILGNCSSSFDEINIGFECPELTIADAGPDQLNLSGGITMLDGNGIGAYESGSWTIISGTGGIIEDITDPQSVFSGISGVTYVLRWTIVNECPNSSFDEVSISFNIITSTCGIASINYEGQAYNTIQIGSQCWMRENLNIGVYKQSNISNHLSDLSNNGTIEKYCYNNDPANCDIYGGLYDWNEMMQYSLSPGTQGICPSGWHIPTFDEWLTLFTFLGGSSSAGAKMKETGVTHWVPENEGATNESGFTAFGGGYRSPLGDFDFFQIGGYFWSSSEGNANGNWCVFMFEDNNAIYQDDRDLTYGFSVRCVKNNCDEIPTQSNTGADQVILVGTSCTLTANTVTAGETGSWSISAGSGGVISNMNSPTSSFTGILGENYVLRWTITNSCGNTSFDEVRIFFDITTATCGYSSFNYSGQIYHVVLIGNQCWMKENLNIGNMINAPAYQTNNGVIEKYCWDNNPDTCAIYGGLYQWDEMMQYSVQPGSQGICPAGWHLPTDEEWCQLTTFIDPTVECETIGVSGTDISNKLREPGVEHWIACSDVSANESGFTALGGSRYEHFDESFWPLTTSADFWTSTAGYYRSVDCVGPIDRESQYFFGYALSVRCVKNDCSQLPTQSDAGPDELNILRISTDLKANSPASDEIGTWSIVNGTGGVISETHSNNSLFIGQEGQSYTLRWTISDICNTLSADEVVISFASVASVCGSSSVVYNGQSYNVILIGTQCWLKENLNIGNMVDGAEDQSDNGIIEKYCYDNDPENCNVYGGLYQWNEMMKYSLMPGTQGICPAGWHVPSKEEWCTLSMYVDSSMDCSYYPGSSLFAGGRLKETGNEHWSAPNTGATDQYGFTALGSGNRLPNGDYSDLVYTGAFWSSSETEDGDAWEWDMYSENAEQTPSGADKAFSFSVRCVKNDCSQPPSQSEAGPDQNVNDYYTDLAGNVPEVGFGYWRIINGEGGNIIEPTYHETGFEGFYGVTYTLIWTISTVCDSTTDTVLITFNQPVAGLPCEGIPTVTFGGQTYNTVQIFDQCWMKENLNTGSMIDGAFDQTNNGLTEKYCYNDDPANCDIYGGLYQWEEMMNYSNGSGNQGICPFGWHIPSEDEWQVLVENLIGWDQSGGLLKEEGFDHWMPPNTDAYNFFGFTALGSGSRESSPGFQELLFKAYLWSSTFNNSDNAFGNELFYNSSEINQISGNKKSGYSIRCVMNSCPDTCTKAEAGPDQLYVTGTTITLAANVVAPGETGNWSNLGSSFGVFSNENSPNSTFTGTSGLSYTLQWEISDTCGNSSVDEVTICFNSVASTCNASTINYGGQVYHTIQIGNQCWMKENLNIGSLIGADLDQTNNNLIEKYSTNLLDCSIYGGLYQWDEMMQYTNVAGARGICPAGWHIPTDAEWCTLTLWLDSTVDCGQFMGSYTGTDAGGKMKEAGTTHWWSPNTGATNESGFTALPAGRILSPDWQGGGFYVNAYFWSSSGISASDGIYRELNTSYAEISQSDIDKIAALSVRCLKNSCNQPVTQANAGQDHLNISGTTTMLNANQPVAGESGEWTILSGRGGVIGNINNPFSTFTGTPGVTYTLMWSISNPCGSGSFDDVAVGFSPLSFICGTPIPSYGGQTYNTVRIGNQCWMKENLNIGTMIPGESDQTDNGILEKYCYNNDPVNCSIYGGLYQWDEMMQYYVMSYGTKGICPSGFHIPTYFEWDDLDFFLGESGVAGGKLKETGFVHWNFPNGGATNETGFQALGAGSRSSYGAFQDLNTDATFWTSSLLGIGWANGRHLEYFHSGLLMDDFTVSNGFSVRCLKDTCPEFPTPPNAGPDQLNLNGTSVVLGANEPDSLQTGTWSIITGTGGEILNKYNPNSTFSGVSGVSYTLRWTLTNACGVSDFDDVNISFGPTAFTCEYNTLTYEGQTYNTVQIGNQCWMKENLNVGSMINGSIQSNNNNITEKYCYDNNSANCDIYGGLYSWDEMMQYNTTEGIQGICPTGWHIPTDAEWTSLRDLLGGADIAGGKMKEIGTSHWLSPNTGATNESGFTALGAGSGSSDGSFYNLNASDYFWSVTQYSSAYAYSYYLYSNNTDAERTYLTKTNRFSVRCLRDNCSLPPTQSDAGPDQLNLAGNSTTLAANEPASDENGTWSIVSGEGGSITGINDPVSTFTGASGVPYILRWTISSACENSSSDEVTISFAPITFNCGSSTLSYGGQIYNIVQIGTQCWMKENLNIGTFVTSINIGSSHSDVSNNGIIEKYCYNNDPANCEIYGGLYDWDEMMQYNTLPGVQGICPSGWHLPTDAEWCILTTYLDTGVNCNIMSWSGTTAGGKMKETGVTHWLSPNIGATNESGFTALGAGARIHYGYFDVLYNFANFWSSTTLSSTSAFRWSLAYDGASLLRGNANKMRGYSIRCTKNTSNIPSTQSDAGSDQLNLTGTVTTLSANSPISVESGTWTIISGEGGLVNNINDPNSIFTGVAGESYTLQWTISNSYGSTTVDEVIISFSFVCGTTSIFYEGQTYTSIQIGSQCWMKENLNIGTMVTSLNTGSEHSDCSDNGIVEKYCYNNDQAMCAIYGGLYDWDEMMQYTTTPGTQGICPSGWHIPTDLEWCNLSTYLDPTVNCSLIGWSGTDAGGKLKETGFQHWISPNYGATDQTGFTALGSGYRNSHGAFINLNCYEAFWTSTEANPASGLHRLLAYNLASLRRFHDGKMPGFSVRCVRICDQSPSQSDAGPDQSVIGSTTTLQANTPQYGIGMWSIISGIGGEIIFPDNPNSFFNGVAGSTYTLRWTVTLGCAVSYDEVIVSFTSIAPENLFLIGGSTPVGWDENQALPFKKLAPGYFQIYVPLLASGGGYKFILSPGNLEGDLGQQPGEPGKLIQLGEENCPVTQDGFYLITVDFNTMTFNSFITTWGITGSAIPPNYWGGEVAMTYLGDSEPYTWVITSNAIQTGEFKFKANQGWAINFGDDENDGTLDYNGANIPIAAGVYTIKIILEPNNWTYSVTEIYGIPCPGALTITYGGQTYNTVQIGSQCWMKENLNVGTMVPHTSDQTNNGIIEKYCFNNNPMSCSTYGAFYQWDEMMQYNIVPGTRGICPVGWHIPAKSEWQTLFDFLGGVSVAGGKMKEIGTIHWNSPNTGATNESGFTSLSGGSRYYLTGLCYYENSYAYLWSSTTTLENQSYYCNLGYYYAFADTGNSVKQNGLSARCIKDTCSQPPTQSNAGPDQLNLTGTQAVLAANPAAAGETGTWSMINGDTLILSNVNNPNCLFTGTPGLSYVLQWILTNSCGVSSFDTVFISFAAPPFTCGNSTFVYDGQTYHTVQIGSQCWMKENLNIGTMISNSSDQTNNNIIEKYCYNGIESNCDSYGGLYQWNEMMKYTLIPGTQGICPSGWHIPDDNEWQTLAEFLGGWNIAGGKMKETGLSHWNSPNIGATNESGFNAMGAGLHSPDGNTYYQSIYAYFWSSSQYDANNVKDHGLQNNNASMGQGYSNKAYGFSVRCMKGPCSLQPTQSDAGPDQAVLGITTNLAGNIPQHCSGIWSIVSGTGGNIDQPINSTSTFNGISGMTYILKWTLTDSCGNSFIDEVMIDFVQFAGLYHCDGVFNHPTAGPRIIDEDKNLTAVSDYQVTSTVGDLGINFPMIITINPADFSCTLQKTGSNPYDLYMTAGQNSRYEPSDGKFYLYYYYIGATGNRVIEETYTPIP